jgi:hypothetical protein
MLAGLSTIYNSAIATAANTGLGKTLGVKPTLLAYLDISDKALATAKSKLAQIESLKAAPSLKVTLTDLASAADTLLKDVRDESNMNTIVDIVANHIGDFDSLSELKEKLPKMPSIKAMQQFGNKLIDLDNYESLGNMLDDMQDFSNLKTEDQKATLKALDDKTLLNKIVAENAKLNINQVKLDVKKMAKDVCTELKLTEKESDSLIALFDTLTTKHLPKLNILRQKLIKELPAFLELEKQRVLKAHPELQVLEPKKSSAILSGFKRKTAPNAKAKEEQQAKAVKTPKSVGKSSKKVLK